MIKLPKWVLEVFEQAKCPFDDCGVKLVPAGVIAVGIREERTTDNKPILSFYYEYKCHKCKKRSQFTGFETTMEDFIGDMLEIANIEMDIGGNNKSKASKISVSEVEAAKKLLRKSKNYKDFSELFGISDVEPDDPNENK